MFSTAAAIIALVNEIVQITPKAIALGLDLKELWDRSRIALDSIPINERDAAWAKLDNEVQTEMEKLLDTSKD